MVRNRLYGGAGDDVISAWSDSRVDGGEGNDVIAVHSDSIAIGGKGDDDIRLGPDATMQFSAGDGKDTVRMFVGGQIQFGEGLSADKMRVTHENGDTIISFEGNETDRITLKSMIGSVTLTFADGTTQEITRAGEPLKAELHDASGLVRAYHGN